ncbi:anaphase-promoting complex subunit 10-like isoform X2 [Watersipora subatra]|uniref:anaphase-promoting complex subunit 10-like isoform X2 n=1 Tax=Watersipora subatra TaxID=2589382 RepID=UPI00355B3C74
MATKFTGLQTLDVEKFEKEKQLREIGSQAVWSLSSCKPGFGIQQLREPSTTKFWQSDDATPHYINIQFKRKMLISDLCIYMDYKNDESYTPNKISIRAGAHFHDLVEVELIELHEPNGSSLCQTIRMVKTLIYGR